LLGAGGGNRTRNSCLEGKGITIMQRPHIVADRRGPRLGSQPRRDLPPGPEHRDRPPPCTPRRPQPSACHLRRCDASSQSRNSRRSIRLAICERRRPFRRPSEPLPLPLRRPSDPLPSSHGCARNAAAALQKRRAAAELVGRVGFEPTYRVSGPGLQPGAFNHSTTYPGWRLA
jgi:hypothetical protein